ncbi:MAG: phospho-N-acetylmuramoyl-pentapeptide-transferase, partial [Oscillospiraceae bacterium]|nr:phospho-N-acetylmuramoyl-pentapeptide-transferase [Oscillospiraceae bacterium]
QSKQGTPTMGGLCFILGSMVGLGAAWAMLSGRASDMMQPAMAWNVLLALFTSLMYSLVGFLDDYIKVVKKRNLGLLAGQKIIMQVLITVSFMVGLHMTGALTTAVVLPVFGFVDLGLFYYPIAFLFIIFMVNAVNLTDGIDGLATGVTFVEMLAYVVIAGVLGFFHLSVFAAALAGGCAGFLLWNFHPAKTFMGDTGSMYLGGVVTTLAFCMGRPELLLFLGFVYICEAGSVVIQVTYFKLTHGKRIFKMTPIHHSFEMDGWSEEKIVFSFSGVALAFAVLAFLFVYIS